MDKKMCPVPPAHMGQTYADLDATSIKRRHELYFFEPQTKKCPPLCKLVSEKSSRAATHTHTMAPRSLLAVLAVAALALLHAASAKSSWLDRRFTTDGTVRTGYDDSGQQVVMLRLDQHSGAAGFNSKEQYLYGEFSVEMKLIRGNSAGTVSCFYVSHRSAS